jgi:hypothetical protein
MAKLKKDGPKFKIGYIHFQLPYIWGPVHIQGGSSWAYGYLAQKVTEGPHAGKFLAFICKYNTSTQTWDIVKETSRVARWRATDQAYRWFCKKTGQKFQTLHNKGKRGGNLTEYMKIRALLLRGKKKARLKREAEEAARKTDKDESESNSGSNDRGGK